MIDAALTFRTAPISSATLSSGFRARLSTASGVTLVTPLDPLAPRADELLSDRRICIKDFGAADLVAAAVEMSAKIGKHAAVEILILDIENAPLLIGLLQREALPHRVGVIEIRSFGIELV